MAWVQDHVIMPHLSVMSHQCVSSMYHIMVCEICSYSLLSAFKLYVEEINKCSLKLKWDYNKGGI